jgi:anti-sigma regulatory factor (Ser/Thr protein kinase)
MTERFTVAIGADAPRTARAELGRRAGSQLSERAREDALLALSELVTNVVRHAKLPDGADITVGVERRDRRIRVTVEQPIPMPSVGAIYEPRGDGGMGLAIVEKVAEAWGVEPGPPGRVWFEVS